MSATNHLRATACLSAMLLLAACSAGDEDPHALSPADEAKAQAMLARYEQALAG